MGVSKILYDGVGIDLTQDTAVESDVASGKYFHKANGDRVQGTASGGGGGGEEVFWAIRGTTPFNDIKNAYLAGKVVMARDGHEIFVLCDRSQDEFNDVFVFTAAYGAHVYGENGITELTVNSSNQWAKESNTLENSGVVTVEGTSYAVSRKALSITENGVTTTYYVADITGEGR